MKKRGRLLKIARVLGALVILQSLAWYVFKQIETRKQHQRARFPIERLEGNRAAPKLEVERRGGSIVDVASGGPRLIHFWATWCPPCREEMPGFLQTARELEEAGVAVYAVSVDDEWPEIEKFFDGEVPAVIVRSRERDLVKSWGVRVLPDAYLVSGSGRLIARLFGPREWSGAASEVTSLLRR